MSSTIFKRIQRVIIKRHGTRFGFSCHDLLIEASIAYAIRRDDWILNRLLGILKKKNKKPAKIATKRYVATLDEDQRFVLSQALQQANWLTFRAYRPRDKSRVLGKRDLPCPGVDSECACMDVFCPWGAQLAELPRERKISFGRSTIVAFSETGDGSDWEDFDR
jgi:hypothetical protein